MPQKPLLKAGKKIAKKQAANRHGKTPQTRKGKLDIAPKKGKQLEQYQASKELTRNINAKNEASLVAKAEQSGAKVKSAAKPPVLATASQKAKK